MLQRKIVSSLENKLKEYDGIVLLNGARQVGKTFIIRYVAQKLFKNFIEINFIEDSVRDHLFEDVKSVNDFYIRLGLYAGKKLGSRDETIIFIDEIQQYPQFLTLLKFLKDDDKWHYIASGSQLGVTLMQTSSIPVGYIDMVEMYPLNFEEYLMANNVGEDFLNALREGYSNLKGVDDTVHKKLMEYFREYLSVGGLPGAVNAFLESRNIYSAHSFHANIYKQYSADCAKYDKERKLKIERIYQMLPSFLENRKKRVTANKINPSNPRMSLYADEFDYIISSGIGLEVKALSNPVFPLISSSRKNLLKIYLNDPGIFTYLTFKNNDIAIFEDKKSVNLGSLYETAVACQLKSNNHDLYYYDNKQKGEVDFLIDDYKNQSTIAIEVKSGKDYTTHRALNKFIDNPEYNCENAIVFSNDADVKKEGKITYLPVYYSMFIT